MKEKNNKTTLIIVVLAVLLLASIAYIVFDAYNKSVAEKENKIFISGTQTGATNTITYLFQQGSKCQTTPISINNQTITLLPLECIYRQASTCQALPVTVNNQTLNLIAAECLQQQGSSQKKN